MNKQKYYVTNGDLGSGNTSIYRHNLHSWQGRAAMFRAIKALAKATGREAWAEDDQGRKIGWVQA